MCVYFLKSDVFLSKRSKASKYILENDSPGNKLWYKTPDYKKVHTRTNDVTNNTKSFENYKKICDTMTPILNY